MLVYIYEVYPGELIRLNLRSLLRTDTISRQSAKGDSFIHLSDTAERACIPTWLKLRV